MKLKILHLSDLHCTENDTAQDIVLNSLAEQIQAICKKESKPDVLIITGDIAHGGKAAEYQQAKLFIDKIVQYCGIKSDKVFMIPGNHDVERGKIEKVVQKTIYQFEDEEGLNAIFSSKTIYPIIKDTTAAYFEFAGQYMGDHIQFGKYGEFATTISLGNTQVRLLGLNSAIFCGYDGDDKRQLALGLEQVTSCFSDVDPENEIIITCLHHPFDRFHECDEVSRNVVQRKSDIILSGHVHTPLNSHRKDGNSGETLFVGAGAVYEPEIQKMDLTLLSWMRVFRKGKSCFTNTCQGSTVGS